MSENKLKEKQLAQILRTGKVRSIQDEEAVYFLDTIKNLLKRKRYADAGAHYGALALVIEKNPESSLNAARSYQKAGELDAAARWFLITANRYAQSFLAPKALAALRMYLQLKPDDKESAQKVYDLCLKNGAEDINPPSMLITDADRAGSKLLASEFFNTFDSSNFENLIKNLTYRKLEDGYILTKMGDQASSLFIIISGTISGYLTLNNKRTFLGDVVENNICGETGYFTGGRRTAEMVAKGVTELFELPYSLLDEFKENHPSFNDRIEALYKRNMLVKQLALTPLFEKVDASCRAWVASKMKPVVIPAGETLIAQGEQDLDVYMVRSGKLAVTVEIDGTEHLVKTVETSGIVGETAIVANKQRTASVRTITKCLLMKLDKEDFKAFYEDSKPIQKILAKLKAEQIKETLNLMKNNKQVEGDETCEILLQNIWSDEKSF